MTLYDVDIINMDNRVLISFDFDGTLTRPDVRVFLDEVLKLGYKCIVVTSRFDDNHISFRPAKVRNWDLWDFWDGLKLDRSDVIFLNNDYFCKAEYLIKIKDDVLFHIDDVDLETQDCERLGINAILVKKGWRDEVRNRFKI